MRVYLRIGISRFEEKRRFRVCGGDFFFIPVKEEYAALGYPHTLVYDGCLHVIVSRRKEAVEVLRVPVPTAR